MEQVEAGGCAPPFLVDDEEITNHPLAQRAGMGDRLNTGQQKIKGYRDLTTEELALVNRIKEHGAATGELVLAIEEHYDREIAKFDTPGAEPSAITAEQEREIVEALEWVRDAKRQLQVGFMLLTRGVTRPRGF